MIKRICSAPDGGIRPPRGAVRDLEENGRWFRPQQNRTANRHGIQRSRPNEEMATPHHLNHSLLAAFNRSWAIDVLSRRLALRKTVALEPARTMGISETAENSAIVIGASPIQTLFRMFFQRRPCLAA